jgi:hypothetical protein
MQIKKSREKKYITFYREKNDFVSQMLPFEETTFKTQLM